MKTPEFNLPNVGGVKSNANDIIKFNPNNIDHYKRKEFPAIVENLPEPIKGAFLEYLKWRNSPVSILDYNMARLIRDYSKGKVAGEKTDVLLCEALKDAMQRNSNPSNFRGSFNLSWKTKAPGADPEVLKAKEKAKIVAKMLEDRQAAGQTYSGKARVGRKGWIHRKPGHS